MLNEAPDDPRHWLDLAQAQRDAGRIAEAAQAFARRAAMGGVSDDVWFARLQEARCRRPLMPDP